MMIDDIRVVPHSAISDLDHKVYTYRGYGREFMKSCRTSPDVYIQLALQYAYYKYVNLLICIYKQCNMSQTPSLTFYIINFNTV
jgi:hypothetical protein